MASPRLQHRKIVVEPNQEMPELPATVLDLSIRSRTALNFATLSTMVHLHRLDISYCNVTNLASLVPLMHLEEIHVDGNPLVADWADSLTALPCLRKISARNCGLKAIRPLEQLDALDLANNQVESLAWLDQMPKLRWLSLGTRHDCSML